MLNVHGEMSPSDKCWKRPPSDMGISHDSTAQNKGESWRPAEMTHVKGDHGYRQIAGSNRVTVTNPLSLVTLVLAIANNLENIWKTPSVHLTF